MKINKLIFNIISYEIIYKLLCLFIAIFTVAIIGMDFDSNGGLYSTLCNVLLSFNGWGIEKSIFVIGLYSLYWHILVRYSFQREIAGIAFVFALLMTLGNCYKNNLGLLGFIKDFSIFLKACILIIGYTCLFYSVILIIYCSIQNMISCNESEISIQNGSVIVSKWHYSIKSYLLLFLSWLPYLIILYPGTILYDTGTQLYQFFGYAPLTNDSPFFQTWLIGSFVEAGMFIGNAAFGVFAYVLMQMLVFIGVLSYMLELIRSIGICKKVREIILFIYALIPIFPLYAVSIGKDINFGIAVLLLSVLLFEIIISAEKFMKDKIKLAILLLDLLVICLFRNAAVVLVIGCIPILLIIAKQYRKVILGIYSILFLFLTLWFKCILPSLGVGDASISANLSIPLQQTARYVLYYDSEISEEEKNVINNVVDYKSLAKNYNPEISDPVKILFNQEATKEDMLAYSSVYIRQFIKHPLCYIDAIINKSYGYFYPNDKGREKPYIFVGLNNVEMLNSKVGFNLYSKYQGAVDKLINILNSFREVPLMSSMTSIGFYSWSLILFAFFVRNGKNKNLIFVFFPTIFVLIGCIASPVNAYFRYGLPVVFAVPFLFSITHYSIKIAIEENCTLLRKV